MKQRLLLVLLVLAVVPPACKDAGRTRVLRLGHILPVSHSIHKAMVFMAERVRAKSSGRLEVKVYPSAQLGTQSQLLELLQLGSVAMTQVSAATMENFAPEFQLFSIPYLFDDRAHQFKVLDGPTGRALLTSGQGFLLRGMAYYDSGSRSFYTKEEPVQTPANLQGLKIRVMNSTTSIKMVRALGGSATPIPYGELYTALQQGVVDGAENNPPSFYLSRHYEECNFYSLDEHSAIPDLVVINTQVWKSLSAEERRWMQEAADESVAHQRKLWIESEQVALAALKAAGVQISYPDKAPFQARVKDMHAEYAKNPRIKQLMGEVRAQR